MVPAGTHRLVHSGLTLRTKSPFGAHKVTARASAHPSSLHEVCSPGMLMRMPHTPLHSGSAGCLPCAQVQDWARQQFAQEVQAAASQPLNLGKACLLVAIEEEAADVINNSTTWSVEWAQTGTGLFATLLLPDFSNAASKWAPSLATSLPAAPSLF